MRTDKANDIYSIQDQVTILPGGAVYLNNFNILNPNRTFKIKSIAWDYIIGVAGFGILPNDIQTTQSIILSVGNGVDRISKSFYNFTTPLTALADNGTRFFIFKPKQYFFDNWFIANVLPFTINMQNNDLALTVVIGFDLIVEIENL
jgi:hypothetical protein